MSIGGPRFEDFFPQDQSKQEVKPKHMEDLHRCTDEAHRLAAQAAETMTHDQAKAYAYGYLFDHYLTLLHNEILWIKSGDHP